MNTPLYLDDPFLHTANSLIFYGHDDIGPYITCDKTVFYPQGGGQPCDLGYICSDATQSRFSIIFVKQVGDEIRHYLEKAIPESAIASEPPRLWSLNIDRERRLLNMRYHTAAHLLSNVFEELYPSFKATKGHSFPGEGYVEFQGAIEPNLDLLAQALSKAIAQDLPIATFEQSREDFERDFYPLPYLTPEKKSFRAVQIGSYPPIPCGGTHLLSTNPIGAISIHKVKRKGEILKVSYSIK